MDVLRGILFQMNPRQRHRVALPVELDGNGAARRKGLLVLRDLVTLWKVRVEVVLAGKDRDRLDLAAQRQCSADRELDGTFVEHRQNAGHTDIHLGGPRVRLAAELVRRGAEELRARLQLRVNLEADHRFPGLRHAHTP